MTAERAYPRKVEIDRAIAAVKAAGIQIGAVRISPQGAIEIVHADAIKAGGNDFDRYEAEL